MDEVERLKKELKETQDYLRSSRLVILNLFNENDKLRKKIVNLKKYAVIDELTGLYNRKVYSPDSKLCSHVVLGDINDFKTINDTYGHDVGDLVLKEVASIVLSVAYLGDRCIRYGGDEILILFGDATDEIVEKRIQEIESNIAMLEYRADFGFPVSLSFGIGKRHGDEPLGNIISEADKNMYINKSEYKSLKKTL